MAYPPRFSSSLKEFPTRLMLWVPLRSFSQVLDEVDAVSE